MKHIILPTIGSAGDVHPVIGLGQGLRQRGHAVTIITNAHFEPLIRRMGLGFRPLGTATQYREAVKNPLLWHPTQAFAFISRHFLVPAMRLLYATLQEFDPKEVVVVAPALAFGARLAQEKQGIPLISAHLQPSLLRSLRQPPVMGVQMPTWWPMWLRRLWFRLVDQWVIDPVVLPELNKFRAELGLPATRHIFKQWIHSPTKVLGLFPDWFAPPQTDWPANSQLTGFLHFEADAERPFPDEVARFLAAGEPPILFTPGSAMQHGANFFKAAAEACQALGRRGLFVSAHTRPNQIALPESICYTPYLPFSQVLPQVAALVFHGGVGTMAQGLAVGVPMLVMPMSHDQPDNAARLKALGVGDYLWPQQFRGRPVAEKLNRLLTNQDVLAACRLYAPMVNFEQALTDSCAIISRF